MLTTHVNEKLSKHNSSVSYSQANAVLYGAIRHVKETREEGKLSEVAMAIVFILEAFKSQDRVQWEDVKEASRAHGSLEKYLDSFT